MGGYSQWCIFCLVHLFTSYILLLYIYYVVLKFSLPVHDICKSNVVDKNKICLSQKVIAHSMNTCSQKTICENQFYDHIYPNLSLYCFFRNQEIIVLAS